MVDAGIVLSVTEVKIKQETGSFSSSTRMLRKHTVAFGHMNFPVYHNIRNK